MRIAQWQVRGSARNRDCDRHDLRIVIARQRGECSMSNPKLEELVQDTRVHRKIYLEQEIFDLEMERIFESNWVFVGHESEIAASGDYKTVTMGTQPAIMTRDQNGDIHVLMNRCMHRGSTVCQEERGNSHAF